MKVGVVHSNLKSYTLFLKNQSENLTIRLSFCWIFAIECIEKNFLSSRLVWKLKSLLLIRTCWKLFRFDITQCVFCYGQLLINIKMIYVWLLREALPRLDNYRISKRALKRPSLGELHGEPQQKPVSLNCSTSKLFACTHLKCFTCVHRQSIGKHR